MINRRQFIGVTAGVACGALAGPFGIGFGNFALAAMVPGACKFVSHAALRLGDTRLGLPQVGVVRLDANTVRVQVSGRGSVPVGASAVAIGLGGVRSASGGYVTAYPSDVARPLTANLNLSAAGQTVQTMAVVKLSASGSIDIYSSTPCQMVIDLLGYFEVVAAPVADGRFVPLAAPTRALDTRLTGGVGAGGSVVFETAAWIPAAASAAIVHITCAGSSAPGWFVGHQDGSPRPFISHLNCDSGWQVRASQAVVPLPSATRQIRVSSSSGGHLVVDVVGYITGPTSPVGTDGLFVPSSVPTRQLDTRQVPSLGRMPAGWTVEAPLPVGLFAAQSAVWNVAITQTLAPGFVTTFAARTNRPSIAQLGVQTANQTVNSHTWARTSSAGISLYQSGGGAVLADMAGYFIGPAATPTTGKLTNVVSPAPAPPYTLTIPRLGLSMRMSEGSNSVVDAGQGWIMPGSGRAGENNAIVVFAHRTSAGGPFRYINLLVGGDELTLTDAAGKRYVYRVARHEVTGTTAASIVGAVNKQPAPSLSLVACSKLDGSATSLSYRLVVTAGREFIVVP